LNSKIISLSLVWLVLAILFGIYDLQISKSIVDQNSVWALFLENYGMIPGLLVILSGIYIYCSFIKIKSGVWSYVQRIVLFLVSSGLIFYLMEILLDKLVLDNFIAFLIIAFASNLIIFTFLQIRKQVESTLAIKYAKIVIGISFFGYVICIQVVKFLWGRVRFRELDAAFSQFTPWYCPQGITGFDSFPSGHAATGFMLLSLLIIFNNKKKWIKNSALLIIILWGTVLSLSRVVIGAHYASDVLFGSFFIIMIFLLLFKKYKEELTDLR
jgi:membrane-associated phospholipid phosphatase